MNHLLLHRCKLFINTNTHITSIIYQVYCTVKLIHSVGRKSQLLMFSFKTSVHPSFITQVGQVKLASTGFSDMSFTASFSLFNRLIGCTGHQVRLNLIYLQILIIIPHGADAKWKTIFFGLNSFVVLKPDYHFFLQTSLFV